MIKQTIKAITTIIYTWNTLKILKTEKELLLKQYNTISTPIFATQTKITWRNYSTEYVCCLHSLLEAGVKEKHLLSQTGLYLIILYEQQRMLRPYSFSKLFLKQTRT